MFNKIFFTSRIILLITGLMLTSCNKTSDVKVLNAIDNVEIQSIYWGDIFISSSLLPGQTSSSVTIEKSDKKLPASERLRFVMVANGKTVYLETEEMFHIEEEEDITLTLDDDTKVSNTNN